MGDDKNQEQQKKVLKEKIRLLGLAYHDFHNKMEDLKKEGHVIVNEALEEVDKDKIDNIINKIKNL